MSLTVRAGEIVAIAGVDGNGQQRARRGDHRPAGAAVGQGRRSTARTSPAAACGRRRRRASPTSPRIATSAGWCSRSRSPRTWRSASTGHRSTAGTAGCASDTLRTRAAELLSELRCPRRRTREHAGGALSGGNQQKVAVAREIDVQSQGARRTPADPRPRRRRDRVRPRPADRGARRGQARSCWSRSSTRRCRSLADRILVIFEGRDRRRVPARCERGGAGDGDDRWHRGEQHDRRRARLRTPERAQRDPARPRCVLAFVAAGLVMLLTGHVTRTRPTATDLQRNRPQLAVPVGRRGRARDRGSGPPADTGGDGAADPHRTRRSRSPSGWGCSTSALRASTPSERSSSCGWPPH